MFWRIVLNTWLTYIFLHKLYTSWIVELISLFGCYVVILYSKILKSEIKSVPQTVNAGSALYNILYQAVDTGSAVYKIL